MYTVAVPADPSATDSPKGWRFALPFALLCAIWSSTWFVIKDGLSTIPPMTGAALRFAIAALVFATLAPSLARREGGARPPAWLSLVMGLCNFAISYGIVYWGEQVLPSGLASVLWATFPMLVVIVSLVALPEERLGLRRAAGFVVGFCGIALLFVEDLRALGPEALGVGALFLLSPVSAAIGNVTIKRHAAAVSSALLNRDGMAIGAVVLGALALGLEDPSAVAWTPRGLASVLYLALPGTVVTFGLYYWLLRQASAAMMSLIAYITPVAALAIGWVLGGEALTPSLAGGAALVIVGVAAGREPRGRTQARDSSAANS